MTEVLFCSIFTDKAIYMGQEVRTGMNWAVLNPYLPAGWLAVLAGLPIEQQQSIQELRLRAGQPVVVSTHRGVLYVCRHGLSVLHQSGELVCGEKELQESFLHFCQESVYAHQAELREGFLSVAGGIRVGVGGVVAVDGVKVKNLQEVTSLCIRLPREHRGCAAGLMPFICESQRVVSTLLVGEPASGKTSLLRDLAAGLAGRRLRVAVVDERGELSGVNGLPGCDVLRGCPKAAGIRQAVRCLAPDVVLFDELGDETERCAIAACAHSGVAVIASLHGRRAEELERKPGMQSLIEEGVFRRWAFLVGRERPGCLRECLIPEVKQGEVYWRAVSDAGRAGFGSVLCAAVAPAG